MAEHNPLPHGEHLAIAEEIPAPTSPLEESADAQEQITWKGDEQHIIIGGGRVRAGYLGEGGRQETIDLVGGKVWRNGTLVAEGGAVHITPGGIEVIDSEEATRRMEGPQEKEGGEPVGSLAAERNEGIVDDDFENYPESIPRQSARRFELAIDPVARARLDSFRSGIKEFQKKHPEVLGATMYGSLIKGEKARAESDVDAFLYIDADAITDTTGPEDPRLVEGEYKSELLKDLGISEEEARESYRDVIPKMLSDEVLDNNIKANIDYEEALKKRGAEEPPLPADNFEIAGMFHARVGTGIEKYRKLYIEKLVALPDREMAEAIWQGVYAQIETMEAGDKERKVPSNLEEAILTYHPELYKETV